MKKLLSAILVFTIIISLCACAKNAGTQNAGGADDTGAQAADAGAQSGIDGGADTSDQQQNQAGDDGSDTAAKDAQSGNKTDTSEIIEPWDGNFETIQVLSATQYKFFWGSSQTSIVNVYYPVIELDEKAKVHFPELKKSLDGINKMIAERVENDFAILTEGAEESYTQTLAEYPDQVDDYYIPFADATDAYIVRADSNVCSVLTRTESYSGGVHGVVGFAGRSFDSQSGRELTLDDVVTDKTAFAKLIGENLRKYYADTQFFDEATLDQLPEYDYRWVLDNNGITVYFNPYDIAPYASGVLTVTIPFKGNESLFVEKYTEHIANYFVEMIPYAPTLFDVDDDGEFERIDSYQVIDPETYIATTTISVDGNTLDEQSDATSLRTFLARYNGKTYAYQFMKLSNDYPHLRSYEISSGKPVDCGWEDYTPAAVFDEENVHYELAINDSGNFVLARRLWLLGTYSGLRNYRIGADGIPASNDSYYTVPSKVPLTFKKSAEFDTVDEAGNVTGKHTSKEGDKLFIKRTDYETYVDAVYDDGTIIRINVDMTRVPYTVDGVPEDDMFDGIIYAG